MKREIKFRAWEKSEKRMISGQPLNRVIANYYSLENNEWADLEIMQFTGLLDKNGKEIYEGDIVTLYDPYTKSQHITEVIWDDVNCRFAMKYTFVDFDFSITDEIEVIGNIYENPELI